jgi:hypothetical protein
MAYYLNAAICTISASEVVVIIAEIQQTDALHEGSFVINLRLHNWDFVVNAID